MNQPLYNINTLIKCNIFSLSLSSTISNIHIYKFPLQIFILLRLFDLTFFTQTQLRRGKMKMLIKLFYIFFDLIIISRFSFVFPSKSTFHVYIYTIYWTCTYHIICSTKFRENRIFEEIHLAKHIQLKNLIS